MAIQATPSASNDHYKVLFFDFGDIVDIKANDIRPLEVDLLKFAPRAIQCSLAGK